jgi:hypothetical protein
LALIWAAGIFLLTVTVSAALFGLIIVLLPARYFVDDKGGWLASKPPLVRWLGIIGKNLLGLVIILIGVALSIPGIPGQGLLTILIGVMLLDIPGKRRLVRSFIRRPRMLRPINRLRSWFRRPPLVVEEGKPQRHEEHERSK